MKKIIDITFMVAVATFLVAGCGEVVKTGKTLVAPTCASMVLEESLYVDRNELKLVVFEEAEKLDKSSMDSVKIGQPFDDVYSIRVVNIDGCTEKELTIYGV